MENSTTLVKNLARTDESDDAPSDHLASGGKTPLEASFILSNVHLLKMT